MSLTLARAGAAADGRRVPAHREAARGCARVKNMHLK